MDASSVASGIIYDWGAAMIIVFLVPTKRRRTPSQFTWLYTVHIHWANNQISSLICNKLKQIQIAFIYTNPSNCMYRSVLNINSWIVVILSLFSSEFGLRLQSSLLRMGLPLPSVLNVCILTSCCYQQIVCIYCRSVASILIRTSAYTSRLSLLRHLCTSTEKHIFESFCLCTMCHFKPTTSTVSLPTPHTTHHNNNLYRLFILTTAAFWKLSLTDICCQVKYHPRSISNQSLESRVCASLKTI